MDKMKKIKFLLILFWNKCSFLHYDRKLFLKLSKCNFLNASGICNFYTCKKLLYWKQSLIVRHFCPTSPMDPIFHIWAVVTCTKGWGKNQGDKWLFTNCQKNEPNLMLGLLSTEGLINDPIWYLIFLGQILNFIFDKLTKGIKSTL